MKTIIAGSRSASREHTFAAVSSCPWPITEVVSGTASGADTHGEAWALMAGVPVVRMSADWSKGRGAGLARNTEMAKVSEALVAAWDGKSPGTKHMIDTATKMGLRVHVHVTTATDPKHGTAERWSTCACKECDEAQRKASNHARKITDADRVNAFLAAVPGEGAAWWRALVEHGRQVLDKTQNRPPGDGTVDKATWGHLRNIVAAARHFAFVLGAAERGDDPDIPF